MRTLKPHQSEGVASLSSTARLLLADDMGLGKTLQAITAAREIGQPGRRVVICPASARGVWERELRQEGLPAFVVRTGKEVAAIPDTGWVVISLPLYRDNFAAFTKKVWPVGVLILDEAHTVKDINSKSNKTVTPLAMRSPIFWPLTGTPVKNDYSEFFALARLVVPNSTLVKHRVADYYSWRAKFCVLEQEQIWTMQFNPATKRKERRQITIQKIVGSQNAGELKAILDGHFLRRTKKQVLKDLPELRWQELYIPGIKSSMSDADIAEAVSAAERGRAPKPHISTARIEWAVSAVPHVQKLVEEHVDADPSPVIVYCNYLEPIALLEAGLRDAGLRVAVITGEVPPAARPAIEADFQAGRYDVLIGQTLAAGVAITLTRANREIFIDLAWSPADNMQARDRAHRIGQTQEVLAQYIVSDDVLSERVTTILARKTREIAELEDAE